MPRQAGDAIDVKSPVDYSGQPAVIAGFMGEHDRFTDHTKKYPAAVARAPSARHHGTGYRSGTTDSGTQSTGNVYVGDIDHNGVLKLPVK